MIAIISGGLAAAIKKLGCEIYEETPVVEKEGIVVILVIRLLVVQSCFQKNSPIHKSIAIRS